MKVQVLDVKTTDKGFNVAYVKAGNLRGTVLASPEVKEPGDYVMRVQLVEKEGRIQAMNRVEKNNT